MTAICPLLSEVLRPQHLTDLTLPQRDIDRLQRMVASGSVMNMLFYGAPGLGKTSAARVIKRLMGCESTEIDGSSATGVDFVRDQIEGFASSVSMFGNQKICVIDEADYLSKQAQAALRHVIEKTSRNCRFIFTANDRSNQMPAIQSRMLMVCFDISTSDRRAVQERLIARYEMALAEAGIAYDGSRLREIVAIYYPDFRSIANRLEYEFGCRPESRLSNEVPARDSV